MTGKQFTPLLGLALLCVLSGPSLAAEPASVELQPKASFNLPDQVRTVAFGKDDAVVMAGVDLDSKLFAFDLKTQKPIDVKLELPARVVNMRLSPDRKSVAIIDGGDTFKLPGSQIGDRANFRATVQLVDAATDQSIKKIDSLPFDAFGGSADVAWSRDGKQIFAATGDVIKEWNVEDGKEVLSIKAEKPLGTIYHIDVSPDGKKIAAIGRQAGDNTAGSKEAALEIWDTASGKIVGNYQKGIWTYVRFLDDNSVLIGIKGPMVPDDTADIGVLDVTTGKVIRTFNSGAYVVCMAVSPDGKWFAGGSGAAPIYLFSTVKETPIYKLIGHKSGGNMVTSVSFSADGKTLLSGSEDKTIKTWDLSAIKAP